MSRWTQEQYESAVKRIGGNFNAGTGRSNPPVEAVKSALRMPAPSKYGNVKTDGYHSKREAKRAFELRLMQEAGEISNLREQVRYEIVPAFGQEKAAAYVADFVYTDFAGREIIEDVKGHRDALYILKRKLMLHVHGIRVREV